MENYTIRRKVIAAKRDELEHAAIDGDTIGALKEANVLTKDNAKLTD